MARPLVLVVEDDSATRGLLTVLLRSHGYEVRLTSTGREALQELGNRTPDVMILHLGLPDMDGYELTSVVRQHYELPIVVLSARADERGMVRALDAGADDYVTKPFREGELMARLRAALRRPVSRLERREINIAELSVDTVRRRVFVGDVELGVTAAEFQLLEQMACHSVCLQNHPALLWKIWGASGVDEVSCLRIYVRQSRSELRESLSKKQRTVTASGVGYRLIEPDADSR